MIRPDQSLVATRKEQAFVRRCRHVAAYRVPPTPSIQSLPAQPMLISQPMLNQNPPAPVNSAPWSTLTLHSAQPRVFAGRHSPAAVECRPQISRALFDQRLTKLVSETEPDGAGRS